MLISSRKVRGWKATSGQSTPTVPGHPKIGNTVVAMAIEVDCPNVLTRPCAVGVVAQKDHSALIPRSKGRSRRLLPFERKNVRFDVGAPANIAIAKDQVLPALQAIEDGAHIVSIAERNPQGGIRYRYRRLSRSSARSGAHPFRLRTRRDGCSSGENGFVSEVCIADVEFPDEPRSGRGILTWHWPR